MSVRFVVPHLDFETVWNGNFGPVQTVPIYTTLKKEMVFFVGGL